MCFYNVFLNRFNRCFPLFSTGNPLKVPFENITGLWNIFDINQKTWPLFDKWLAFLPTDENVAVDPKNDGDICGVPRSVWQLLLRFIKRYPKKIDKWTEDDADSISCPTFADFAQGILKESE